MAKAHETVLNNSKSFKFKIMDNRGIMSPLEVDSGLCCLLEVDSENALNVEFDFNNEKIVCKVFTRGSSGYPEKYEFTMSQFARLLRTSNRKKNSPLDDEQDIFAAGTAAKIRQAEKKEEQNAPVVKPKRRRRKLT